MLDIQLELHQPEEVYRPELRVVPVDESELEALFSLYLERADDEDNKVIETWKKETGTLLIFTGLFSAALAALLAISVLDLQSSPQDASQTYLKNIFHLLANATTSQPIILPTPLDPPDFSPPTYVIWVNALWFLSLVMSLTGALLLVFVQQWAHSYLRVTQRRQSRLERVKARAFYTRGLKKSSISFIVRAVPVTAHASFFTFFIGLTIWLFNINPLVCWPVVAWLGLSGIGYAYITIMPILHQDSPFSSPLSWVLRRCKLFLQLLFFQLFEIIPRLRSSRFCQWLAASHAEVRDLRTQLLLSMHQARVQAARALSDEHIYDALVWTFESLKRDSEFERFYDAIPNLCASRGNHLENFIIPNRGKLSGGLVGLMDRTFSSNLVAEHVKSQRIKICMRVADATQQHLLGHRYFLCRVLGEWSGFLGSVPFGRFVQNWLHITNDASTILCIRFVVSAIIAIAPPRDETWAQLVRFHQPWIQLVRHHLDVSECALQEYIVDRHKLSLANLNCVVSHITQFKPRFVNDHARVVVLDSFKVLESICTFV